MDACQNHLAMCDHHVHRRYYRLGSGAAVGAQRRNYFGTYFQQSILFLLQTSSMFSCSNRNELQMALKSVCETPQTQWKHVGKLSTTRLVMRRAIVKRPNMAKPPILSLLAAVLVYQGWEHQAHEKVCILLRPYEMSNVRCMQKYQKQEAANEWMRTDHTASSESRQTDQ